MGEPVYICVDQTRGAIQVCIETDGSGFRLLGPKYDGTGKRLHRKKIDARAAAEIRALLDKAFPPEVSP